MERHFEGFERDAFKEEQNEDPRIDDAFSVIDEDLSDPHFTEAKPRPDKLTDSELEVAKKFNEDNLTEEELNEKFEKANSLKEGNPRFEFLAAIRNKVLTKKAWRRLEERKKNHEAGE